MLGILTNTPLWVWGLLAALVALGAAQIPERRVSLSVVLVLPIAVVLVSAFALLAAFGPEPMVGALTALSALAGLVVNKAWIRSPREVRWDATARQFVVPGSWLPLVLILAIFACRFAVGVAKATNPGVAGTTEFLTAICVITGVCCGIFLSRAANVLAMRSSA